MDNLSQEDASEWLDQLEERLGELKAQAQSETTAFGDAWPGAWVQIGELEEQARALRKHLGHPEPAQPSRPAPPFRPY